MVQILQSGEKYLKAQLDFGFNWLPASFQIYNQLIVLHCISSEADASKQYIWHGITRKTIRS